MTPVVAHFDGLVEPRNPGGHACGGWVILAHPAVQGLETMLKGYTIYGHGEGMTSNLAEYSAALDALRAVYRVGWRGSVMLRGDSQLVIRQTTGQYACNVPHLIVLRDKLRGAMTHFESVTLEWVGRDDNEMADQQSRIAYESARRMFGNVRPDPWNIHDEVRQEIEARKVVQA